MGIEINKLRYPGERSAYFFLILISILVIIISCVTIFLLPILLAILFLNFLSKLWALASIKANGIRVSEKQYSQIYNLAQKYSNELKLKRIPEIYIVQNSFMNAFAVMIIRSRFVVLFSEIVDAALENNNFNEVGAILVHELGHHAAGHTKYLDIFNICCFWLPTLLLYWSRRGELTCDRIALKCIEDKHAVFQALIKLAVGRKLASSTDLQELLKQQRDVHKELFVNLSEFFSTHPHLTTRIKLLDEFSRYDLAQ